MSYKEKIVNAETGEEIFRDYSPKQIAEVEAAETEALRKQAEAEAKEAARQAVLTKLGLTAEDISALGL